MSCTVDDEAVILDLAGGVYYGLNPVGARVWNLIQEPTAVEALCSQLLEEFDVERERCLTEVLDLLEQLAQRGLIETNGHSPAADTAS